MFYSEKLSVVEIFYRVLLLLYLGIGGIRLESGYQMSLL